MRKYRFIPVLLMLGLIAVLMAVAVQQPSVAAQGENLLTNGSFEGAYSSFIPQVEYQSTACPVGECTTAQMPLGWFPWWVPQTEDDEPWFNRMPEYKPVCPFEPCPYPERLQDGPQALQYFTFHGTHTAGLWQRVQVPTNANLKFFVWGQAWSSATDATYSDFPTTVNMRIGIDPTGGTNPFSGSVVWSAYQNPYDAYSPFEVEAVAQGDTITVFMWSQPLEARKHNDIYWDGATLTANGTGFVAPAASSGTSAGTGAAAPAPRPIGPTPTPNAEGQIIIEVQPGDSLWSIAARSGITLDELLALNPSVSRDAFVKQGDQFIIGSGDPSAAPVEEAVTEGGGGGGGEDATGAPAEDAPAEDASAADEAPAEDAPAEDAPQPEQIAAVAEGGAPAEEMAEEANGGAICLRAYDDANEDGVYGAGEVVKDKVAFTISNGEAVVSNYVTNGSEPFCIEGLAPGTYRVTRSFEVNEVPTNAADWAIAVSNGTTINVDFGSKIDTSPQPAAEVAAVDNSANDAASEANTTASDADAGQSSTNWMTWVVGAIIGLAVLLLIGVGLVVASTRRS